MLWLRRLLLLVAALETQPSCDRSKPAPATNGSARSVQDAEYLSRLRNDPVLRMYSTFGLSRAASARVARQLQLSAAEETAFERSVQSFRDQYFILAGMHHDAPEFREHLLQLVARSSQDLRRSLGETRWQAALNAFALPQSAGAP